MARPGKNASGLVNVGGGKKPGAGGAAAGVCRISVGSGKIGEGVGVSAPRGVIEGGGAGVSAWKTVATGVNVLGRDAIGVGVAVAVSVDTAGGWVGAAVAGAVGMELTGSD